jgi:hypothetical protein
VRLGWSMSLVDGRKPYLSLMAGKKDKGKP